MPASNMYVCLIEPKGLRFPYYKDEKDAESTLDLFPKGGLTGYVIDSRKRYWMTRDPPPPDEVLPVGTIPQDWIGIPLFDRSGEVLGVFTVQTYTECTTYSDKDADFLAYTANALAMAIQLAMLDREIATRRIAALVEEIIELKELYPRIHEIVYSIIPAARRNFIIARIDEQLQAFQSVFWVDEKDDDVYKTWPLHRGYSGFIYSVTRQSFIYEYGKTILPEGVERFGSQAHYWLGAPLFSDDRIIGLVAVQSYDVQEAITKEDEHALNAICPYIATAISQTELLSRIKRI
jgi:GAF domain-containing protein